MVVGRLLIFLPGRSSAMKTILLVEDNEMNRDMLARRLRRRDFEVIMAVNGVEAVEKAREAKPDLILMDLGLPLMDGWEATSRIKADETTADIPLIALTAHALEKDRQRAFDIGCDAFETKPVALKRLLGKIEELIF